MKWLIFFFILSSPIYADPPEWYVDQSRGIGNCGPAVTAMSINKIRKLNLSTTETRSVVGYRIADGGTLWEELLTILEKYNVKYYYTTAPTLDKLINTVIDYHTLVIILLDPSGLSEGEKQMGRGYSYNSTAKHYVVLDNYKDGYFLVQDPIPGNYNRRYKDTEVWKLMTKDIIIIYE